MRYTARSIFQTWLRRTGWHALLMTSALVALLAWGGREVTFAGIEAPTTAERSATVAKWADEVVLPQVAALGCTTEKRLTERVAVRNAVGFDKAVVRVVSFDEAWASAQAGKVVVVGWCE